MENMEVIGLKKIELISEIFRLHREDKKYREIAQILKISKSYVGKLVNEAKDISRIVTGGSDSKYLSDEEKWKKVFPKYAKQRVKGLSRSQVAIRLGLDPETESDFDQYYLNLLKDELATLHLMLNIFLRRTDLSITAAVKAFIQKNRQNLNNCNQKNRMLENKIAELEEALDQNEMLRQQYIGVKASFSEYILRVLQRVREMNVTKTRQGFSISIDSILHLLNVLSNEAKRELERLDEKGWLLKIGRGIALVKDLKKAQDYVRSLKEQLDA
jgi:DNA-binding CsgD family transcriptional regulator